MDEFGDAVVLPRVRPVELVAEAMLDGTEQGGIVLHAFCGSGTMLAAAHRTGRLGALWKANRVIATEPSGGGRK